MAEGAILASYRFDRFKSKKGDDGDSPKHLEDLTVIADGDLAEAIEFARVGAEAENFARELQDLPSNVVTPSYLAGRAQAIAEEHSTVTCEVMGRKQIAEKGMGGLVAVSQGSAEEPQLIVLRYQAGGDGETLGLVGKGVTFDSGGISIKPSAGMQEMKMDMSGAAAVLEAVSAIAKLEVPINILAVIPSTENMPSGTAVKPGDIITQLNGKTVEVNNTDAEGRLILADALAYSVELGADRIVDLATLTGAVIVALGSTYAGLISNDDAFAAEVEGAASPDGRARLAAAAPPRVQGADQGHRRRPHQRLVEAQGLHHLRGLVPRGVRRRQALGPPRHRRHGLGRGPRVRGQGAERLRGAAADRPRPLAGELDREQLALSPPAPSAASADDSGYCSKTRQVLVPLASNLPVSTAVSFASATAVLRPRWMTSASARTAPVSRVMGRRYFTSRVWLV